jgi:hypothetical protein
MLALRQAFHVSSNCKKPKMKVVFLLAFVSVSSAVLSQSKTDDKQRDISFYTDINKWFGAWSFVSKDIFGIDTVRPVEFVFFDDKYVYSTSTTTIKIGETVKGCNLMNLSLDWKKKLHDGKLTMPDNSVVPVGLMSFAAVIPNTKDKSFFVMPLLSFWERSGVTSKELGLQNLVTGVFIHEFSHSQQMQNFGKRMTYFEQQNNFGVEFSDDVVQNVFGKDSTYLSLYKQEIETFYQSIQNQPLDTSSVKEGLRLLNQRQSEFFKGQYSNLKDIDNFFLTMEGLGQYSMYLWLVHPKGAHIKNSIAIEGVRRKGRWWSQDEGFALFLILSKLAAPQTWVKDMFGNETESVVDLINNHLQK